VKVRLAILLFIFSATPLWAAGLIGASYDEVVSILGEPGPNFEFVRGNWIITTVFGHDSVTAVNYRRREGGSISAKDWQAFDATYGGGYHWRRGSRSDYSLATAPEGMYTLVIGHLTAKKSKTSASFADAL
jgi:hypothetical protein